MHVLDVGKSRFVKLQFCDGVKLFAAFRNLKRS
jgi:hypothetical protein